MKKRNAFTLAEVLITLGIIGIVAAMTMPMLIAKHRKSVVETRLKKIYSSMNQAINLSETVNGDKITWTEIVSNHEECRDNLESDGCRLYFFNTYLKDYLKYLKYESVGTSGLVIYLADGSALRMKHPFDYYFYPNGYTKTLSEVKGKNVFPFHIAVSSWVPDCVKKELKNNSFEPYLDGYWDCTSEGLYTSPYYSTKLIQHNGWKIPDDYPW